MRLADGQRLAEDRQRLLVACRVAVGLAHQRQRARLAKLRSASRATRAAPRCTPVMRRGVLGAVGMGVADVLDRLGNGFAVAALAAQRQRLLVGLERLAVASLLVVDIAQVVERRAGRRALPNLLVDGDGLLVVVERLVVLRLCSRRPRRCTRGCSLRSGGRRRGRRAPAPE